MIMNMKQPEIDQVIYKIYDGQLKKSKNIKTAYSIYTPYQNQNREVLYFYMFKISSNSHLSQGTVEYALKKYNPFLSKVEFLEIQKHFNTTYYLIKCYKSLTTLDQLISLKKQCQEIMEKQYILKVTQFLITIYKSKKWMQLPQLSPKTIGINQQGQLKICDYSLYFKHHLEMRSLTENLCSCLNPMIKIDLTKQSSRFLPSDDDYQRLQEYYGTSFANLIKVLVLDPMDNIQKQATLNGKGKQCNLKKIEQALDLYYKTSDQDLNITVNETHDQQDIKQSLYSGSKKFIQSDLLTADTMNQPLLGSQTKKSKFNKKIVAIAMILIIILLGIGTIFILKYYSNQRICQVGYFKLKDTNQCLACTDDCLKCESGEKTSCLSCSPKMFLILNDQKDIMGLCDVSCSGKIIRSNLCLKNKTKISENQ